MKLVLDEKEILFVSIIAYTLIGFLTFGERYAALNHDACRSIACIDPILPILGGIFWPLYWVGHFFIFLFW
jgi:hypothetical protein